MFKQLKATAKKHGGKIAATSLLVAGSSAHAAGVPAEVTAQLADTLLIVLGVGATMLGVVAAAGGFKQARRAV